MDTKLAVIRKLASITYARRTAIAKSEKLDTFRYGLSIFDGDGDIDSAGIEVLDSHPCGDICFSVWERELPCCRRR